MKKEELERIRNNFDSFKKQREDAKKIHESIQLLDEEMHLLEEDPQVKRYISLNLDKQVLLSENQDYDYWIHRSDNDLLKNALYNVAVTDTQKIYVYRGTYMCNNERDIAHGSSSDYVLAYDDKYANYRSYIRVEANNLDSDEVVNVPITECENFEKTNIVLYPVQDKSGRDYYYEVKYEYFENAIKYGQEKAMERVLQLRETNSNPYKD